LLIATSAIPSSLTSIFRVTVDFWERAGRRITRFCTMRTCSSAHYFCPSLFEAGIDLYVPPLRSADALQALAFSLCHVYARATRSVSIPAPVYCMLPLSEGPSSHLSSHFHSATDADIVCARAKTHYDPNQGGLFSDSGTVTSQGAAQNLQAFRAHFKPLSEYAQRHMYFSVGLA
jgi:hypothetical protein